MKTESTGNSERSKSPKPWALCFITLAIINYLAQLNDMGVINIPIKNFNADMALAIGIAAVPFGFMALKRMGESYKEPPLKQKQITFKPNH